MKKVALMLLILLLTASAACAEELAGTWYLHYLEVSDSGPTLYAPGIGMIWDLNLNEDGTGQVVVSSSLIQSDDPCTWFADGDTLSVTVNGSENRFAVSSGQLVWEEDGTTYVWRRGVPGPEYQEDVPFLSGLQKEAFHGRWECIRCRMEVTGIAVPLEMPEINATLLLEDSEAKMLAHMEDGSEQSLSLFSTFAEVPFNNSDAPVSVLTIQPKGSDAAGHIQLALRQDGLLVGVEDGNGAVYYFQKVPN